MLLDINNGQVPHIGNGCLRLGVDLGSTTAKLALISTEDEVVAQEYRRHRANIQDTLLAMLQELQSRIGDVDVIPSFTGSAGMGMSERTGIPFVQEVVAASKAVMRKYPQAGMMVDIGGEDSKMIFFQRATRPDMRMNGNCAGGTGAFIDQMASLINIAMEEFDQAAARGTDQYTIASRCGVFAKTDVQNLVNNGASKDDIARAVFQAVACQAVTSLTRGHTIAGPVVMVGGPLSFFSTLRKTILEYLFLDQDQVILPQESLIFPAFGTALSADDKARVYSLSDLITHLQEVSGVRERVSENEVLFADEKARQLWTLEKSLHDRPLVSLDDAAGTELFLGIDAGSTTTKIVLIDERDQILFRYYAGNKGEPIASVKKGLEAMQTRLRESGRSFLLRSSAVTGYGEELIQTAFDIDHGIVETLAHYRAAKELDPNVSFILDIGGQDMKAIFIQDGAVQNIEVNEACSSGCGSFIETFADSLGYTPAEFGELACTSTHPVDLGSRCTVFMNSCVKQALRQGSEVADVSAGLAYSVIQNCLHKVLRIPDSSVLGDTVIVQGGTFKNPAVLRALENLLSTKVIRPNIAEYMGAYGAAITARENAQLHQRREPHPLFASLEGDGNISEQLVNCKGCTNHCRVRVLSFGNKRKYYTGNRCERIFTNRDSEVRVGANLFTEKLKLVKSYPARNNGEGEITVGIPMVMNVFENYPFWSTLFSELGWHVVASEAKNRRLVEESAATIMSDNICYPAKLAHAHVFDLIGKKVDRIFYPRVVFEHSSIGDAANRYNCPIVTGYPDVVDSAVNPEGQGIFFDSPTINFHDKDLLKTACRKYLKQFKVKKEVFERAFAKALAARKKFKRDLLDIGHKTIDAAREKGEQMIVLAGRPYHIDPMINHSIPDMIAAMGVHVLVEDALPHGDIDLPESLEVADQWEYSNRLYRAAHWAGQEPLSEFIQFNSFGCGPDAVVIDEVKSILKTYSMMPVVLKIDEITSIGSAKLRVRSLLDASLKASRNGRRLARPTLPIFEKKDRKRKVLVPDFSPFYSFFAQSAFTPMGYDVEILPPPDKESMQLGLRYANNDICYPAIVTIGDAVKALKSGKYKTDEIALAFTETGGQCRATNYVSLLKKAILNAGFSDVPVVSATFTSQSANKQPGFEINRPQLISLILSSLLVVDQLIRMYHVTAVREKIAGQSLATLREHLANARANLGNWKLKKYLKVLEAAIRDFNEIEVKGGVFPKAGLVGEIYVKYNPFSNGNIVDRLMKNGIEVVIPPLITFFIQSFVNVPFNHRAHIEKAGFFERRLLAILEQFVDRKIGRINVLMENFRHPLEPLEIPSILSQKAEKVVNLANQAGEGWLLPGEIISMAEAGVKNIISLQPFGCIANHVVAKGIGMKLAKLFPDLNFLNLDMDAGNSDANVQNRLDFFVHSAKEFSPSTE